LKKNAARLRQALADSHTLAARLDEPGFPLAELELIQSWQRQRLADTYADLTSQDRYSAAGDFFLDELYGGLHFRERDQEMERVLPVMVRMLRNDMLLVLAEAFELQSLSLDFDIQMTKQYLSNGWDELSLSRYAEIYRACGHEKDRQRQIELIHRLGLQLNSLVHHRLVMMLIRILRGPAIAAGFGLLQSFLEGGLNAFRVMGDGTEFIDTIKQRETEFMHTHLAGED
jgi:hypothetical protein